MCGIAGIIGLDTRQAEPLVSDMLGRMPYRGPDDRGVWSDGDSVTLGHLRLSIIDLSLAGHQPMVSFDDRFVLIFNGEIFNYIELRDELKTLGGTFSSATDSEVIIEAYRIWGADCVSRFNGMWAFALYDQQTKTFFASRDRFGVKPFFYSWDGSVLRFASEMKALLRGEKGDPNWQYFYHFFDRHTPLGSDATVFNGIRHLRPSHSIVIRDNTLKIQRYWQSDPTRPVAYFKTEQATKTAFRELLIDAVRLRLRSDVPVGVCLSGGIDSSTIAMIIASLGVRPETFSTVYTEPKYTEENFIDLVNGAANGNPHKLTPVSGDFFAVLEKIVTHHDEPVRMPGVFSHWHVMECAKNHVTVLLDGQGADEILGGYREFYPAYLQSLLMDMLALRRPLSAVRDFRACTAGLHEHFGAVSPSVSEVLARILPTAVRSALGTRRRKNLLFSVEFLRKFGESATDDKAEASLLRRFPSALDREMYRMFIETNLPMLLRYEDRNSMAFSLEARVPFLDYRVVEFAQSLDYRMKIRGYTTKWILREAFKDLLPREVYERKDKKGFPTPTSEWFAGPLSAEVRRRLKDSPMYDLRIMDRQAVLHLVEEHCSGHFDYDREIFRLLSLDVWLRQRVDQMSI